MDADLRILRDERAALMGVAPMPWVSIEDVSALGVEVQCWAPAVAKRRYLNRLADLLPTN